MNIIFFNIIFHIIIISRTRDSRQPNTCGSEMRRTHPSSGQKHCHVLDHENLKCIDYHNKASDWRKGHEMTWKLEMLHLHGPHCNFKK